MRVYCVIFLILSMFEKFQDKSLQGNNYQFKVKKKTQYVLRKKKIWSTLRSLYHKALLSTVISSHRSMLVTLLD